MNEQPAADTAKPKRVKKPKEPTKYEKALATTEEALERWTRKMLLSARRVDDLRVKAKRYRKHVADGK